MRIHTYLSKGSFDGYRYQSIAAKKDWQDLIWSGGDTVENLSREGNISRDEMMIMLAADPDAARAVFEADKDAAVKRFEAGERAKAGGEYVRFQSLTASFKALKNTNTASAARLRAKLDTAKTSLKGNKYFTAKHLLDSGEAALIEPTSGAVFHAGAAFEAVDKSGAPEGKYVVTGVNVKAGTVTVRGYADLDGRKRTLKVDELKHGVTPFAFDGDAEAAEVGAKMESQAADQANSITDYKQLASIPAKVLSASYDSIQRQLKEGAKSYKMTFPHGQIPMVNRETGGLDLVEHYSLREKVDTHDFLMPTEDGRKRMEDAWLAEERGVRFGTRTQTHGRRGSQTKTLASKKYPGARYDANHINPWSQHVAEANGETFSHYESTYGSEPSSIKALRNRLQSEQIESAKRAKTLSETIDRIAPTGRLNDPSGGYGSSVTMPKRAIAVAWAKARHLGALGDSMKDHEPKSDNGRYGKHSSYFLDTNGSVHASLVKMALKSRHEDLAVAMVESGLKHHKAASPRELLSVLHEGYHHSKARLSAMLKLAEAAGIADMKAVDHATGIEGQGVLRPGGYNDDAKKTVREILQERMKDD